MQNTVEKKGLDKASLQLIAVLGMTIDHMSVFTTNIYMYYIMKLIGRITIIIMSYFIAEGYHKTSNVGRYIARLGIFAAISQIPFYLFLSLGNIPTNFNALVMSMFMNRNVIFTLFVGLSLLMVIKSDYNIIVKIIAAMASLWLVRCSDWGYTAVLWIVGFGVFYGSQKKQKLWLCAVLAFKIAVKAAVIIAGVMTTRLLPYSTLFGFIAQFGGFIALPLISQYNGERGKSPKWGLYIFYPVHMLVILAIYLIVK